MSSFDQEAPEVSIVIPCFNEAESCSTLAERIAPVVSDIRKEITTEVIFVDDGSSDGTSDLLSHYLGISELPDFKIVRHQKNLGLGAALKTGFEIARGRFIITTDSDGTYAFSEIRYLLQYLLDGYDVVTASPYHPDGKVLGVSPWRLALSRICSGAYRMLGFPLYTYTALFRAYRKDALRDLEISDGFIAVTEILVQLLSRNLKVVEHPAILTSRQHGISKMRTLRTMRCHLGYISRIARLKTLTKLRQAEI